MAAEFDPGAIDLTEIVTGLMALAAAPVVLPLAAGMRQPAVRQAVKTGITLVERCKEALAEVGEHFDDLAEEARQDLQAEAPAETFARKADPHSPAQVSADLMRLATDLNTQISDLTHDLVDLRTLAPLGLGAIALRQLLIKGLQLEDIPWYVLAWYAFDSFVKLHPGATSQAPTAVPQKPGLTELNPPDAEKLGVEGEAGFNDTTGRV
jgi:hypothetical protein